MTVSRKLAFGLVLTLVATFATSRSAGAQTSDMQRNCQTITTCNFAKGGSYRGCLSSYSCRQCGFIAVRCQGRNARQCRELRCNWGA